MKTSSNRTNLLNAKYEAAMKTVLKVLRTWTGFNSAPSNQKIWLSSLGFQIALVTYPLSAILEV